MIKNWSARISRIKNPQKMRACIHPARPSLNILLWPNAMQKVFHSLWAGRSSRFSPADRNSTRNLGHNAQRKAVSATRVKPNTIHALIVMSGDGIVEEIRNGLYSKNRCINGYVGNRKKGLSPPWSGDRNGWGQILLFSLAPVIY